MTVDKIKAIMKEKKISQEQLATLLCLKTGQYYNQSMISKHLSHDNKLRVDEKNHIVEVIKSYSHHWNG